MKKISGSVSPYKSASPKRDKKIPETIECAATEEEASTPATSPTSSSITKLKRSTPMFAVVGHANLKSLVKFLSPIN